MDLLWVKAQIIQLQILEEHLKSQVNQQWDIKRRVRNWVDQMVEIN